jgi:hypothetical protein
LSDKWRPLSHAYGEQRSQPQLNACIEDPVVIKKMLAHLKEKATLEPSNLLPEDRGPPQAGLFD